MAHIPGDRPYTVTHKSRVASYILTHAHEHPGMGGGAPGEDAQAMLLSTVILV